MKTNWECKRCHWKWKSGIRGGPKACPGCKSTGWRSESKGRGNWVPEAADKIKMVCSICNEELKEGQDIYRFQGGKNIGGIFVLESKEMQGVYCEDCSPEEDVLPFAK